MGMTEQHFLVVRDSSDIDMLDENVYSYDTAVFTLTPAIQSRTSDKLIQKVIQFIESVPALEKAADYLQSKTEYILRDDLLTDEIKALLKNGQAEIMQCRDDDNAFFLAVRAAVKDVVANGKAHNKGGLLQNIPLGTKTLPTDVVSAAQCLSMQAQLSQISERLKEISEACEFNFSRIIQGQRDDRIAKLLSSRSCFIQAIAISDDSLQRQMLLQAILEANSARAELAFQIKSDILLLSGEKVPKSKDMEKIVCDINTAVVAINNAVQVSLYSYQALGEHKAQLVVVKEHEVFIKQVLLKKIKYKGEKHFAWDLICSSGNSESVAQDFDLLPKKLINSCNAFIENKKEILTITEEVTSDER